MYTSHQIEKQDFNCSVLCIRYAKYHTIHKSWQYWKLQESRPTSEDLLQIVGIPESQQNAIFLTILIVVSGWFKFQNLAIHQLLSLVYKC